VTYTDPREENAERKEQPERLAPPTRDGPGRLERRAFNWHSDP